MSVKTSLGKFGSRFAFEFFLETIHDTIIEELKKYLSGISPKKLATMISNDKFPSFKKLDFSAAGDHVEHIEKISLLRLMEFIAEARPDLFKVVEDMGGPGATYMAKLRLHMLGLMGKEEFKPEQDVVMAHCDVCDKKWPVKKDEVSSVTVCPFCGAGGEEGKEAPPVDEKVAPPVEEEKEPPEEE